MHSKFNQAINFFEKGNLNESKKLCLEILNDEPKNFDILHLFGIISFKLKDYKNSADLIAKAITINPKNAEAYNNHSLVLKKINKLEEAVESLNQAIKIKPDFIQAYNSRGHLLVELNQLDEALENFNKAIKINPNFAEAYNNRGNILNKLNRFTESIESYDKAISINPNFAEAYNHRGGVQKDIKLYEDAHESYEKAIKIKPNLDFLLGSLIYTKLHLCNWKAFDENLKKIEESIIKGNKSLTPFSSLLFLNSPSLQKKVAEIYIKAKYNSKNNLKSFDEKSQNKKIRVGYYSADFREHVMSDLLIHLFKCHDKSKFELIGFSFIPGKPDHMHNEIKKNFDQFFDVSLKTDKEIAKLSQDMNIDIAVDLMGLTTHSRTGIFTECCTPIKINFLGYPGTLGTNCHDYIIADKTLIPEKYQKDYSEKIIYLPDSYKLDHSSRKVSNKVFTRKELRLPKDGFVFCCFNNNFKITPNVFNIWMNILKNVKDSVLWLMIKGDNLTVKNHLKKEALKKGIESDRLIFANRMSLSDHLARLKLADLFIDTMPYNAHTTASDALWVGLPFLTLCGETFASRVGASMLNAIELNELITLTEKGFENLAIDLAKNPKKLQQIKNKLNNNKISKPLFNTKLFTKNIEKAYSIIYEKYLKKLPRKNIEI
jgi:predicted O-linked N-acetylglucosamine transferase (SPINDLY family)